MAVLVGMEQAQVCTLEVEAVVEDMVVLAEMGELIIPLEKQAQDMLVEVEAVVATQVQTRKVELGQKVSF